MRFMSTLCAVALMTPWSGCADGGRRRSPGRVGSRGRVAAPEFGTKAKQVGTVVSVAPDTVVLRFEATAPDSLARGIGHHSLRGRAREAYPKGQRGPLGPVCSGGYGASGIRPATKSPSASVRSCSAATTSSETIAGDQRRTLGGGWRDSRGSDGPLPAAGRQTLGCQRL